MTRGKCVKHTIESPFMVHRDGGLTEAIRSFLASSQADRFQAAAEVLDYRISKNNPKRKFESNERPEA